MKDIENLWFAPQGKNIAEAAGSLENTNKPQARMQKKFWTLKIAPDIVEIVGWP